MKKMMTNTVLFVSVIMVWGIFGYKIYQKRQPTEISILKPQKESYIPSKKASLRFALLNDYENPFRLNSARKSVAKSRSTVKVKKVSKKVFKKKEKVSFPKVDYKGFIQTQEGQKSAVVTIGTETFNWKINSKYKDLYLTFVDADSILVKLGQEERSLLKSR